MRCSSVYVYYIVCVCVKFDKENSKKGKINHYASKMLNNFLFINSSLKKLI
jgi:hypothetical protein